MVQLHEAIGRSSTEAVEHETIFLYRGHPFQVTEKLTGQMNGMVRAQRLCDHGWVQSTITLGGSLSTITSSKDAPCVTSTSAYPSNGS